MPFVQTVMPQFRDADPDGYIGLKGAMHYFQDIHTWYMHSIDKGNDVLPENYRAAWVYTRYLVLLSHKVDYTEPVRLSTWMEPYRQPVLVNLGFTLRQHGRIAARGRLENCVFSLERQRPLRLSAIEFPEGIPEAPQDDIPPFIRLEKTAEGMQERYVRTVRCSDLDKSSHMTNLRYIEMFQDAYDDAFWRAFRPDRMELCFLSQCREGECLSVRSRMTDDELHLAAVHADGSLASVAMFAAGTQPSGD